MAKGKQAAEQMMGGVGNKGGVSKSPSTSKKTMGFMKHWLKGKK